MGELLVFKPVLVGSALECCVFLRALEVVGSPRGEVVCIVDLLGSTKERLREAKRFLAGRPGCSSFEADFVGQGTETGKPSVLVMGRGVPIHG